MGPIGFYSCKIRLQFPALEVLTIVLDLIWKWLRGSGKAPSKFSLLWQHFLLDFMASKFVDLALLFPVSDRNYSWGPIHLWYAVYLVACLNSFSAVSAQISHLCFPKTGSVFSLRLSCWKIPLKYWTFCWKYWTIPSRLKTQFSWCSSYTF